MIRYLTSTTHKMNKSRYLTINPNLMRRNSSYFQSYPCFFFSNHSEKDKINNILRQITITKNNQKKSILQSNMLANFSFQQSTQRVIIDLNTSKDFMKVKNILINKLNTYGYTNIQVNLAQKKDNKIFQRKGNLIKIKKIIAVSSCKGGVGKSTVAVNIAFTLQKQGYRVGIFDADVYGPSLPTLINKEGQKLSYSKENSKQINPIIAHGVKCMSFGFVSDQPATIRGPMASSIVAQLLLQTLWQQLDYLIVDMPPGTGDINLTVCQELKFDGAIIVTTPQKLSYIDVLKGIQTFQDLRVRIIAIVQNMSYYSCQKCNKEQEIFGKGYSSNLVDQLGMQSSFKIPLSSQVNKNTQIGRPHVIAPSKNNKISQIYQRICKQVRNQLQKPVIRSGAFYSTTERLVIVQQKDKQKKINPVQLRSKCRCDQCVKLSSNQKSLSKNKLDPEVYPVKIQQKGNYAIGVIWSDGHKNSIYSFKRLFSEEIIGK